MQAYHACVTFIDVQIALMLDALKESGQWDNTIIVFTSDHGYHLGDHFLWGKVTLFDIGARVPFIVHVPGMTKQGCRSDVMVELTPDVIVKHSALTHQLSKVRNTFDIEWSWVHFPGEDKPRYVRERNRWFKNQDGVAELESGVKQRTVKNAPLHGNTR